MILGHLYVVFVFGWTFDTYTANFPGLLFNEISPAFISSQFLKLLIYDRIAQNVIIQNDVRNFKKKQIFQNCFWGRGGSFFFLKGSKFLRLQKNAFWVGISHPNHLAHFFTKRKILTLL